MITINKSKWLNYHCLTSSYEHDYSYLGLDCGLSSECVCLHSLSENSLLMVMQNGRVYTTGIDHDNGQFV